jgi:PAS domain S-box-containing protein
MSREDSSGQVLAPPDALERVRDGVVALDTDFVCTYVNDAAAAFFGRPRADLPGTSVWEVLGDDADLRDRLETASETGRRTVFEHADADGERWLEGRVYPEADGVTVYLTETTARTEADSARHRRNCQLTTLVENLTEAVYAKDADGYYEFANEPAAALFGVDAADLVGARDEDLFDDETAAAVRSVDERVTARDAADSREVVREVDGETRVFCAHTYPVHDEEGTVVGVVGRSRDVTGHAARERERERQQYLFDSVQDVADIGVWEYELATGTLTWSDGTRAIHGVDASYEPTVTDALAFYHPDDREQVEAAVDRAREHGDRYDLDLRLVRADGDVRDVRTYGEVVVDDERDGPVLRGVIQDITEHRARERELEQYRAFVENSADTISIVDGDGSSSSSVRRRSGRRVSHPSGSSGRTRSRSSTPTTGPRPKRGSSGRARSPVNRTGTSTAVGRPTGRGCGSSRSASIGSTTTISRDSSSSRATSPSASDTSRNGPPSPRSTRPCSRTPTTASS